MTTQHWLTRALVRAGIESGASAQITGTTSVRDAWNAASDATGMSEEDIAAAVAGPLRVPLANLESWDRHAAKLVPEKMARQHGIVPIAQSDRQLVVATSDPMDFAAEQTLSFASGRSVVFHLAGPESIDRALRAAYSGGNFLEDLLHKVDDSLADAVRVVENLTPEEVAGSETEARPLIKLVNMIITDAIRDDASDVHIEPASGTGVVRFRVDGVLRPYMQLPLGALTRVVSRIKIMAEMDIADRIRPQDGRSRIAVGAHEYDLRLSTVPASGSEKVVIRVLYPKTAERLDDLQLPQRELKLIRQLLNERAGIVIVTGPTGSGKTTTLYAGLRELATGKVNITTIEDPVEYELDGITQIQVETKRKVTFASALRAVLRQDPDVVLVGEIRDQETAQIALQAALTGHLVLATVHTNDAPTAVSRLLDLGLDPANVAAALKGVIAQRLLRRLCKHCQQRTDGELTPEEQQLAERYGVVPPMRGVGCERCAGTGYRGRLAVMEVLVCGQAQERAIAASAPAVEIRRISVAAGMRSMTAVALEQVVAGTTTLHEVERVLGGDGDVASLVAEAADAEKSAAPAGEAVANTATLGNTPAANGDATTAANAPAANAGDPAHVLVVDDDDVIREITAETLRGTGMSVTEAKNGEEALELLRHGAFSLVVLDLDMPVMDGLTALREIRKDLKTAAVPVIVLTADRDAEVQVMDDGADDYLAKPLDPARLTARTRAVLRRRAHA